MDKQEVCLFSLRVARRDFASASLNHQNRPRAQIILQVTVITTSSHLVYTLDNPLYPGCHFTLHSLLFSAILSCQTDRGKVEVVLWWKMNRIMSSSTVPGARSCARFVSWPTRCC